MSAVFNFGVFLLIAINSAILMMEMMDDFEGNMKIILVRTNLIIAWILVLYLGN